MNSSSSGSVLRILGACLVLSGALHAAPARSQTGEPAGQAAGAGQNPDGRARPSFSAAGVQGSTAPPGYSSGLSREETSTVMTGVMDLNHEILSSLLPAEPAAACSRAPDLLQAQKANPAAFGPNHALGLFYLSHGDVGRSISYLEAASRAEPNNMNNSRALAVGLLAANRSSEAIDLLKSSTGHASDDTAGLRLLAFAYQIAGDRQQSIEAYRRALAVSPGDADNEFACGIGLITAGAPDVAGEVFRSAALAHPAVAKLWFGLGLVRDLDREKAEAADLLLRAVAINPEYMPPYFFLASLADAVPKRSAEIRKWLAEFVVSHPDSAEAHYDYALALWKQHRIDQTVASDTEIKSQLQLALARDPKMARAHYQLGVLDADLDDSSGAERELLRAVQLEPDNADAHYRLAQAYRRNHELDSAAAEMRRFLALHGAETAGEINAAADLENIGPSLLHEIGTAAACDGQPRQLP